MMNELASLMNLGDVCFFDDVCVSVIEEPKIFFDNPVNKITSKQIIFQIKGVIDSSFDCDITHEVGEIPNHIIEASMIALAVRDEKIVGFASCKIFPFPDCGIFFLYGVAVGRNYKRRHIALRIISLLLKKSGMKYLALTTQSPIMYCLVTSILEDVYPKPCIGLVYPFEGLVVLARRLITLLNQPGNFDEQKFVLYSLYKECLYQEIPKSGSCDVDRLFFNSLDINCHKQSKDGILVIGKIRNDI